MATSATGKSKSKPTRVAPDAPGRIVLGFDRSRFSEQDIRAMLAILSDINREAGAGELIFHRTTRGSPPAAPAAPSSPSSPIPAGR